MFCNQCGSDVPNGVGFCPNCGAPVEQPRQAQPQYQQPDPYQQPQYQQPVEPQYQQPVYGQPVSSVGDPQERALAKTILVFGILAIAFACTYYVAFMGIVFGAITSGKVKQYIAMYPLSGKAKTGSILGKVGLILGIVLTVLSLITIIACSVAACAESASSSYYYYY